MASPNLLLKDASDGGVISRLENTIAQSVISSGGGLVNVEITAHVYSRCCMTRARVSIVVNDRLCALDKKTLKERTRSNFPNSTLLLYLSMRNCRKKYPETTAAIL